MSMGLWKWAGCACHRDMAAAWASWALGTSRCGQVGVVEKGEHPHSHHQNGKTGSSFHGNHGREVVMRSVVRMTTFYGNQGGGDGGFAAPG